MGKLSSVLFRRSPFLVSYWEGSELVFENYATGVCVGAAPLTSQILHFFDRWRSVEALSRRMRDVTPASVRTAVVDLAAHSLLQRSDRPEHPAERALASWSDWSPSAGFFHFSTKDVPFIFDVRTTRRMLRRWAKRVPPPSPVKQYPDARQVRLPRPKIEGEFPRVLLARRTWRSFSPRPIDLDTFGTLLGLTWGVLRWVSFPGLGRLALKTSPSGGARHPVEVYVLALRVAGLPRGLYHYAPHTHRLELLRAGTSAGEVKTFLAGQWFYGKAAALMLMTAVFPRSQWKYRYARAYRAVLLDAGHICQTFCLVATWLGLAPFCTAALADTRIEKTLGVDGVTESVLYAAGVGARPPGKDWAPWPPRGRPLFSLAPGKVLSFL